MFDFFLLCILFSCCCSFVFVALVFCTFLISGHLSKTSLKNLEIAKKNKNEKCRKKDTGTRAVSTGVLTNSVFFGVSLNFAFCWKH